MTKYFSYYFSHLFTYIISKKLITEIPKMNCLNLNIKFSYDFYRYFKKDIKIEIQITYKVHKYGNES